MGCELPIKRRPVPGIGRDSVASSDTRQTQHADATDGSFCGRGAGERARNTNAVVTGAELIGLRVKIDRIPEECVIQIFAPDRPDQSLNERCEIGVYDTVLDLFDFEDSQVREPAVKAEQGIMIRTDPDRWRLAADGLAADAESDDAAGEYVDDHPDPMTAKEDRFAPKQVDAPEPVLGLGDESEPGGTRLAGMVFAVMLLEDPAHDILSRSARRRRGKSASVMR